MKNRLRPWILLSIVLLGLWLRFYKLGEIPNGLYQDETAIGYNAYSLIRTGKDEHNTSWPQYFKSFGDYKLPVYVYLTALSVKLFGLSGWSVRLPSALFGTLTIVVLYLFMKELCRNQKLPSVDFGRGSWGIPETTAFFLTLNPWHLHYSRATFEVSVALFFFLLGGYLLLKNKLLAGVASFIIALYTYNLTRLLSPLLFVFILWQSPGILRQITRKQKIITAVVALLLLLPFFFTSFSKGGAHSARGTFIFTSAAVQAPLLEFRSYLISLPALFTKAFFNQALSTVWLYLQNITRYLSVEFFFLTGSSHGNHGIGNVGQFYLFELPLMLAGVAWLLPQKGKLRSIVFGWGVLTVAVAALTREAPHATRSFFLVFPLLTLSAIGALRLSNAWKTKKILVLIALGLMSYNILYYFSSYYIRFPLYYAKQWRAADQGLALYLRQNEDAYRAVVIDKQSGFIYTSLLFYAQYPPGEFLQSVVRTEDDSEGFTEVVRFGKYEFRNIDWNNDAKLPKTLLVTTTDNAPQTLSSIKQFSFPSRPVVIAIKQQIAQYPVTENAYILIATE